MTYVPNPVAEATDWSAAPLRALIAHIEEQHHGYLRRALPAIAQILDNETGEVFPVKRVFTGLKMELEQHLMKEEVILFPFIERMERCLEDGMLVVPPPFGTVGNPVRMMVHEHDSALDALDEPNRLTNDHLAPADTREGWRVLCAKLADLERDLRTHISLENDILFPRAQAMEAKALR